MIRKSILFVAASLFLLSSALAQVKTEAEPNDSLVTANDLKLGQSVEGYFGKKDDVDWYKLINDKPGKSLVQIDLSAVPGVVGELNICNEKGIPIWKIRYADKNDPRSFFNLALAQGVYYVCVWTSSREPNIINNYTLTTKILGPWQEGMEAESNNRKEEATELRLGQNMEGYCQYNGDEDYYKIIIDNPGKSSLQVDLSAVPGVDMRFEILDPQEKILWGHNDFPKGEPESVKYFTVTEGTYYIRVQGNLKNVADKYVLTARVLGPWKEGQEAEPNENFKEANELRLDVPMMGRVDRDSDIDHYVLKIPDPGPDIMLIQISGIPGDISTVELFDAKEKKVGETVRGEPGSGGEIVRMRVKPGTYYLRVSPPRKNKRDSEYTLYAGKPQKPPASPGEVQQALIKALDWLAKKQDKSGSWKAGHDQGFTGLALMAFIGGKCVPSDHSANIKLAVDYLKSVYKPSSKYAAGSKEAANEGGRLGPGTMYEHGIATLALIEALVDTNDAGLEPIVQDALDLIIRSQNTERKPGMLSGPIKAGSRDYGGWRYSPNSPDSDISITGWQALALKAAVNAGFSVPDYIFPTAAGYVRSLQGKGDGSFKYNSPDNSPGGRGDSCARAGMGAFILQVCGFPQDPAIPPALRFMQDNAPRWNIEVPGDGYPFYYWYYGTRAMYVSGGDDWRIWKDWMCRFLVDHQNGDGSWEGERKEQDLHTYRVALGALMLEFCCGQVPIYMSPVKRTVSGPGTLEVDFEKGTPEAAGKAVEIIMDASNSMTGLVGKETKIVAARRVLTQTINGLPGSMSVGFRVYGHRFATDDYDNACGDTELLAPIGPVNKAALVGLVNKIQTKGRTPLVLSVLAAIKDFEKIPNGSIILVTDGIESCKGDIATIAPAIKKAGLELEVNIVGFDIKEAGARQELESIARSTGGRYLDAKDADELLAALAKALKLEYVVLDGTGKEAGKGVVGGPAIKLNAGVYTVRVLLSPQPVELKVTVKSGATSTCTLKKTQGKWGLN